MTRTIVIRKIDAPKSVVFRTVADIREFFKALPHIVDYEFLSELEGGVGTRFREIRNMKGKNTTTELEVTEYVENEHIRLVADGHGTVWDTTFRVASEGDQTLLTMTMDAKAYKLLPKIMNPLVKGLIKKAVEKDMDLVKAYCERAEQ